MIVKMGQQSFFYSHVPELFYVVMVEMGLLGWTWWYISEIPGLGTEAGEPQVQVLEWEQLSREKEAKEKKLIYLTSLCQSTLSSNPEKCLFLGFHVAS